MNDADLEELPRRYRLVNPPPSLADRLAASAVRGPGHAWGALAAAAIAAIWLAAHAAAREPLSDPLRERMPYWRICRAPWAMWPAAI